VLTYLGQAIFHAIVAAAVVEALLRVWRIEQADARLTCRFVALVLPLIALPSFYVLAPVRATAWFADRWAILSISRWNQIRIGGIGLDVVAIAGLGVLGVLLFLLDLLPALRTWLVDRRLLTADQPATMASLEREVGSLTARMGVRAPSIRLVHSRAPVLLCSGLARARLVVSTGAAAILDDRQLRAGLAHELAHARYRDPLLSWTLMAVRTLFFFSPATQFLARSAVDEVERRADDLSVTVTSDRLGMAGALVRLFVMQHPTAAAAGHRGTLMRRVASWFHVGRTAAVERRCRRLLSPHPPRPEPFRQFYAFLTGFSLVVLLFFVV
jgi:hypothetical protein